MPSAIAHDQAISPFDRHGPQRRVRQVILKSGNLQAAVHVTLEAIVRQAVTDLYGIIDDNRESLDLIRKHKPEVLKSWQTSLDELEATFRPYMKPGDTFPSLS